MVLEASRHWFFSTGWQEPAIADEKVYLVDLKDDISSVRSSRGGHTYNLSRFAQGDVGEELSQSDTCAKNVVTLVSPSRWRPILGLTNTAAKLHKMCNKLATI